MASGWDREEEMPSAANCDDRVTCAKLITWGRNGGRHATFVITEIFVMSAQTGFILNVRYVSHPEIIIIPDGQRYSSSYNYNVMRLVCDVTLVMGAIWR